jgi:Phage integrase family
MAGIRRAKGTAPETKAPTLTDDIRAMCAKLPEGLLGVRDRALLLLGFAGAFRRSELVSLDVSDLELNSQGLVVMLRRSKTDQEGAGRKIGIPYGSTYWTCPVRSLQAWLEESGIVEGPLFRCVNRHGKIQPGRLSGFAVSLIVKRYAAAAGLDVTKSSGHSLRAGFATSAAIGGASERAIMNQTGHRSTAHGPPLHRDADLFRERIQPARAVTISRRRACQMLGIGDRRLRQLVRSGRLETIGRGHRKAITLATFKRELARRGRKNGNQPCRLPLFGANTGEPARPSAHLPDVTLTLLPDPDEFELMSLSRAAAGMGISSRRLRGLVDAGEIPTVAVGARRLISTASLRVDTRLLREDPETASGLRSFGSFRGRASGG